MPTRLAVTAKTRFSMQRVTMAGFHPGQHLIIGIQVFVLFPENGRILKVSGYHGIIISFMENYQTKLNIST